MQINLNELSKIKNNNYKYNLLNFVQNLFFFTKVIYNKNV